MPVVYSVSVLPEAIVNGPFMVESNCSPCKKVLAPKVVAARWTAVGVAPNSPTVVFVGAVPPQSAAAFIVVVSAFRMFAAWTLVKPNTVASAMMSAKAGLPVRNKYFADRFSLRKIRVVIKLMWGF